jgi:hypothetical protein
MSWLRKNADTRKIDTIWDRDAWTKRSDIELTPLQLILATYRSDESARSTYDPPNPLLGHSIAHTIEMVSLSQSSGKKLDKNDIISLCHGYGGDTMFALADAIISMNISLALDILHRITQTSKVDEWFSGLIGTLRNTLYIKYLKEHGTSENMIGQILNKQVYK